MSMATHEVAQDVHDLDTPDRDEAGRLMYYEHQVQRSEHYSGFLDEWPIERVRLIFREALLFTDVCSTYDLQLPPAGLPGHLHAKYDQDEPAAEILGLGLRYLSAIVFNERRAMHNRWQEARDFVYAIERRIRKECEDQFIARQVRDAEERSAAIEAAPQSVYFIGSESGPIKIGIAARPLDRLRGLQTGHHEKLELLATCAGGQPQERDYHKRFADRRLNGEWFERCHEIEAEIERIRRG